MSELDASGATDCTDAAIAMLEESGGLLELEPGTYRIDLARMPSGYRISGRVDLFGHTTAIKVVASDDGPG